MQETAGNIRRNCGGWVNGIETTSTHFINYLKFELVAESRCLGTIHFELHAGLAELGRRAIKNGSNFYRSALDESIQNAEETVRLLQHEPILLSEGQICHQAKQNLEMLKMMLASAQPSKIYCNDGQK